MDLRCDKMVAFYTETREVKRVECTGGVQAQDGDRYARGERAEYDVSSGVLVVTGSPEARQGTTYLKGTKVRLTLGSERVEVENARIVIETLPRPRRARQARGSHERRRAAVGRWPPEELPQAPGGARRLLQRRPGRGGGPAGPQRRREDDELQHGGGARHPGRTAGFAWTTRTSPTCPCTGAPGGAWATCRRRPRSSASSPCARTSWPCWSSRRAWTRRPGETGPRR